jgi:hypothetical protein
MTRALLLASLALLACGTPNLCSSTWHRGGGGCTQRWFCPGTSYAFSCPLTVIDTQHCGCYTPADSTAPAPVDRPSAECGQWVDTANALCGWTLIQQGESVKE